MRADGWAGGGAPAAFGGHPENNRVALECGRQFLSPLWGLPFFGSLPTPYRVGCILSPLRGWTAGGGCPHIQLFTSFVDAKPTYLSRRSRCHNPPTTPHIISSGIRVAGPRRPINWPRLNAP